MCELPPQGVAKTYYPAKTLSQDRQHFFKESNFMKTLLLLGFAAWLTANTFVITCAIYFYFKGKKDVKNSNQ